jgi:hypothetical protein
VNKLKSVVGEGTGIVYLFLSIAVLTLPATLKQVGWESTPPLPGYLDMGLPSAEAMRVILSFVLVVASLSVILGKRYKPPDKRWAYATVATILGFWLHAASK